MIESGFYQWATQNAKIQKCLGSVTAADYSQSFYFSFLAKNPVLPAIVLDRLSGNEDEVDSLDVRDDSPAAMCSAKFQFGCCAQNDKNNPQNPDGYLSAAALALALRRQLIALANGDAALPDGTVIKDVHILDEFDAHFEMGGTGYTFRRILQVEVLYGEAQ